MPYLTRKLIWILHYFKLHRYRRTLFVIVLFNILWLLSTFHFLYWKVILGAERKDEAFFLAKRLDSIYTHIPSKGVLHRNALDMNGTKVVQGDQEKAKDIHFNRFAVSKIRVSEIDCAAVFRGDTTEIDRARSVESERPKVPLNEAYYVAATRNCSDFIRRRGYIMSSMTKEEENFPIAYSILAYRHIEQTERLLRAIYRPQNFYCIHIDKKSIVMKRVMESIVKCFGNVKMAESVDVTWAGFSVLQADLNCMETVWEMSARWKYFINLAGEEFPLRTNAQIVKILTLLNGANSVKGSRLR